MELELYGTGSGLIVAGIELFGLEAGSLATGTKTFGTKTNYGTGTGTFYVDSGLCI